MITVGEDKVFRIHGLSTDRKPTNSKADPVTIGNGSVFYEMDTSKKYLFDAENKVWNLISSSSGDSLVAGEGITIDGNVIKVDTQVIPEKTEVKDMVDAQVAEVVPEVLPEVLTIIEMDGGEIE